jgi:hypothetical protein
LSGGGRGVWDRWAHLKVAVFSWQVLLGRLSASVNLGRRGVWLNGRSNMLSLRFNWSCLEKENHLLLCLFAWTIWVEILQVIWVIIRGTCGI